MRSYEYSSDEIYNKEKNKISPLLQLENFQKNSKI